MIPGIEEKLKAAFPANSDHRIIRYWYDGQHQYANDIDNYHLENVKILKISDHSYFSIKYTLEIADPESNYLLYAPFEQPADKENPIADIIHYSKPFHADAVSIRLEEFNYPNSLRPIVEKYIKFWNNKERLQKYLSFNVEATEKEICLGILAVLSDSPTTWFSDILTKVIQDPVEDNPCLKKFTKCGIIDKFWEFCEEEYGYKESEPKLEHLIRTLFVTDIYKSVRIPEKQLPPAWSKYLVSHLENIDGVILDIRRNTKYKEFYKELAETYEAQLNPGKNLFEALKDVLSADAYLTCDTFECFDKYIVTYLNAYLVNNKASYPDVFRNLERRKYSYYAEEYKHQYGTLEAASNLLDLTAKFEEAIKRPGDSSELLQNYLDNWQFIDKNYRLFYENYDQIEDKEDYHELRTLIEGKYTSYLEIVSVTWTKSIENSTVQNIPLRKQMNFYSQFVEKEAKNARIVVIISDALRYETANELCDILNEKRPKYQASIQPLLSTYPSKTELGMAALLPHREMTVSRENDTLSAYVDGCKTRDLNDRNAILQKRNPNSIALRFDDVMAKSRAELQDSLENKKVVYIYHNKIDSRGDAAISENQVFAACRETINDIKTLINKLTQQHSISNFIVTADHGFLYLRNAIPESSKITVEKQDGDYLAKRFILGQNPNKMQGTFSYSMKYIDGMEDQLTVTMPYGVDLFKKSGSGLQYVHGGASLQESLVPLLTLKTQRGKENYESAGLALLSKPKITSITGYITFMQKNLVSDTVKPFQARIYIVDKSGQKVTTEDQFISAGSETERPEFRKKFTLIKNIHYSVSEKYTLIIEDADTEAEYERIDFTIDIPFISPF